MLVHGAWHGPWAWDRVTPLLDERGIAWTAVDRGVGALRMVSSDARLDARRVREAIAAAGRPVVLVGHSQGGIGITHGGAGEEFVRHLVYLTAILPGADVEFRVTDEVISGSHWDEDGGTFDSAAAPSVFYGDCDAATVAWALARIDVQAPGPKDSAPLTEFAWQERPAT